MSTHRSFGLSLVAAMMILAAPVTAMADDVAELDALLESFSRAWDRQDTDGLRAVFCTDGAISVTNLWRGEVGARVVRVDQVLANNAIDWERYGGTHFRLIAGSIDIDGNAAIMHLIRVREMDGRPRDMSPVLGVALREDGDWRIAVLADRFFDTIALVEQTAEPGLRRGDVVVACDGQPVTHARQLQELLKASRNGTVDLAVRRDSSWDTVSVSGVTTTAFVTRVVPRRSAVLLSADTEHPIRNLIAKQVEALRSNTPGWFVRTLCPAGFLGLWSDNASGYRGYTPDTVVAVFERDRREVGDRLNLEQASVDDVRIITYGDLAMASWRLHIPGRNGPPLDRSTSLQIYARQRNEWGLAAELPLRIEIGLELPPADQRTAAETAELQRSLTGELCGLGAQIESADDGIRIVRALPGSGAADAGLSAGDVILAIDGETTRGMALKDFTTHALGPPDTGVQLRIRDAAGERRHVTVTRKKIVISNVEHEARHGCLILRVQSINQQTAPTVRKILSEIDKSATQGIVLDLRACAGGLYDECRKLAGFFLKPRQPMWVLAAEGEPKETTMARGAAICRLPVAVLVGPDTGGGAELIAAALQHDGRATLFGDKTSGTAALKQLVTRTDGSSYTEIRGHFYTVNGDRISGNGIRPDRRMSPERAERAALRHLAHDR